jgi:hypothetical protein
MGFTIIMTNIDLYCIFVENLNGYALYNIKVDICMYFREMSIFPCPVICPPHSCPDIIPTLLETQFKEKPSSYCRNFRTVENSALSKFPLANIVLAEIPGAHTPPTPSPVFAYPARGARTLQ